MSVFDLFLEGGFIMWPLLICSIAIWAVVLEKTWFLSKFQREAEKLHGTLLPLFQGQKWSEVKTLCEHAHSFVSGPHLNLIESMDLSEEKREERLRRKLSETKVSLKKSMWILGTIGTSAPFIGLFGTVVGIIKSFQSIERTGKSGFSVVAGDLSEALVATAAGILVAVIAVIFYNYFQTRINTTVFAFKNRLEDLNDFLPSSLKSGPAGETRT